MFNINETLKECNPKQLCLGNVCQKKHNKPNIQQQWWTIHSSNNNNKNKINNVTKVHKCKNVATTVASAAHNLIIKKTHRN